MGTKTSKPTENTAEGAMSNANSNSLTIVESVQEHSETVKIFLIIIAIILLINFAYKVYTLHKRCIQKNERNKSRITLSSV